MKATISTLTVSLAAAAAADTHRQSCPSLQRVLRVHPAAEMNQTWQLLSTKTSDDTRAAAAAAPTISHIFVLPFTNFNNNQKLN